MTIQKIVCTCSKYPNQFEGIVDDKPFTPHRVAQAIKEVDSLDSAPSTGAVKACFDRWQRIGFAEFTEDPFAFAGYTEQGRVLGLKGCQEQARAARLDSRPNGRK